MLPRRHHRTIISLGDHRSREPHDLDIPSIITYQVVCCDVSVDYAHVVDCLQAEKDGRCGEFGLVFRQRLMLLQMIGQITTSKIFSTEVQILLILTSLQHLDDEIAVSQLFQNIGLGIDPSGA